MEKHLSKKFLRVNDLNQQINETENEIKRLYLKQKKDERRIQQVLRNNNRAMEEIEGTQEELSMIYDVALQVSVVCCHPMTWCSSWRRQKLERKHIKQE